MKGDEHTRATVVDLVLFGQSAHQPVEFPLASDEARSGPESPDHAEIVVIPVIPAAGCEIQRYPQVGMESGWSSNSAGHHSNHGKRIPVQDELAAQYPGVTAKALTPQSVSQDRERWARFFVQLESSAQQRLESQNLEEVRTDLQRCDPLGQAVTAEVEAGGLVVVE